MVAMRLLLREGAPKSGSHLRKRLDLLSASDKPSNSERHKRQTAVKPRRSQRLNSKRRKKNEEGLCDILNSCITQVDLGEAVNFSKRIFRDPRNPKCF